MVLRFPSRPEQAYASIKHRILHGDLVPGALLSEGTLARQLHASRTPIREALSRLVQEGYVERVASRGYFVAPITMTLVQNLFEVRRLLEGEAAARAAERADESALARLREVSSLEYSGGDAASFGQAAENNDTLHMAVALASQNAIFVDLVRRCLDQVTRLIALGIAHEPLAESARAEHEAIVEAIEKRHPAAARAAMERHVDHSSRAMLDALVRGGVRALTV
jgi:DNA-binding GntR family transcriptional regulator